MIGRIAVAVLLVALVLSCGLAGWMIDGMVVTGS